MKGRAVCYVSLLASVVLVGCMGTFNYAQPARPVGATYARTVAKGKEDVWRQLVLAIDKDYLVLDRLDKDAGVIMVTYRGDPEWYVDCGRITSYVQNMRGGRTYRLPAAAASSQYEIVAGTEILVIESRMILEGQLTVNVVAIDASQTQVSANAHYGLTRTETAHDTAGRSQTVSHALDFRSGHEGAFPSSIICRPTGKLENEALSTLGP